MKHSGDRILTTHAGSLPRPHELLDLVKSGDGAALEQGSNAQRLRSAVSEIVRRQAELGVDVIDDGEYGRNGSASAAISHRGGRFTAMTARHRTSCGQRTLIVARQRKPRSAAYSKRLALDRRKRLVR